MGRQEASPHGTDGAELGRLELFSDAVFAIGHPEQGGWWSLTMGAAGKVRNIPVERIRGVISDLLYGTTISSVRHGLKVPVLAVRE